MTTDYPVHIPEGWNIADLSAHLGGIPPDRILTTLRPGTATEVDFLQAESQTGRICELIDGVLVAKTAGVYESYLAARVARLLGDFVERGQLGIVLGADAPFRILPNQIRIPDASYVSWGRFPSRKLPRRPILELAPDLAIEVLSQDNTPGEMERRLRDYFWAGVRLVWYLDAATGTAEAYAGADQKTAVHGDGVLDGVDILPGFRLPLAQLFAIPTTDTWAAH